jgi:hypothetical protein
MIKEGELIRVMFTEEGSFPLKGCRVELTAGHVPILTPDILFKEVEEQRQTKLREIIARGVYSSIFPTKLIVGPTAGRNHNHCNHFVSLMFI